MSRDPPQSISANHSAPRILLNVRKQRNHQQPLLRRVQEVRKEIPVDMPPSQVPRTRDLALELRRAQVHDERVVPGLRGVRDALLPADDLADCAPCFGREFRHSHAVALRHVCPFGRPGGFVGRGETEACPDRGRPFVCLLAREAVF